MAPTREAGNIRRAHWQKRAILQRNKKFRIFFYLLRFAFWHGMNRRTNSIGGALGKQKNRLSVDNYSQRFAYHRNRLFILLY
jgi:hypothetical protein